MADSTEKTDLREYLRPVLKRWWLILAVVPIVTIGTYLYYDHKPKVYSATTELFVRPSPLNQVLLVGSPGSTDPATIQNLAILIPTRSVVEQVEREYARRQEKSKSSLPPLEGGIAATPVEESSFIAVTGTAARPAAAARIANAYAQAFVATQTREIQVEAARTLETARQQLSELDSGEEAEVRREALEEKIQTLQLVSEQEGSAGIKQVEPAIPSPIPVGHNPKANALFAFVLSLMLSIGAAFGLEYLNRKIGTVEDVADTYELPILTEIPDVDAPSPMGEGGAAIEKQLYEPFHRLQMNLDMLAHERPLRTILVVSAAPNEGKSMVTRNLALAFREAGRNVAMLDADFRKATLGNLLETHEGPGLTDILAGRASFGQAVQEVSVPASQNGNGSVGVYAAAVDPSAPQESVEKGDIAVVPAGAHHGDLAAVLASGGMRQTLSSAVDVYDRVLIDSSPILAAADVLPLLSEVDGVLLVTRLGVSTRDSAKRLLAELKRMPRANLVGVVVNGIPARTYRTRAYGYYYG